MNRLVKYFFTFIILSYSLTNAQDIFTRTSTIPTSKYEPAGFSGIIAGVDWDNDGLPEIYACNANYIDTRPGELIPRIYKFEWNETTAAWDSVWGATLSDQAQNTWPATTWGDLDKDGKIELIWCPVNFPDGEPLNPDPLRIIVYEVVGDGSDNLGVDDGFGSFLPNASTTIVEDDNFNLRPTRTQVLDIDSDGQDEIIFTDQAASSGNFHFGVLSVDEIPDNGGGLETWTIEKSGLGDPILAGTGNKWDMAILNNYIYLFYVATSAGAGTGVVYPIRYTNNAWETLPGQRGVANGDGSFKGSVVGDMNNDGTDEIVVGTWWNPKIYLLKQVADTLQSFEIADFGPLGGIRLNGAAAGDLDNDGNVDFVFGTRNPSTPNNSVYRLEYQGGDITDPANYTSSIIDSFLVPAPGEVGGDLDVIYIANIDGDLASEVIYTQGYSRGNANDTTADVAILDIQHTPVSVELADDNIPDQYYLDQNFPNPFNPSTTIKFGLITEMAVELKIFDALGQEVLTLIDGQLMKAGSYNVNFNASNLASGTYIYRLKAGDFVSSQKMILLK